jgi:NADPH:quinone reductase-like Zn-dependent oxidoreductase
MRAIVIERHGAPDVLTPAKRPEPERPDGWVLVELRAAALNWHDCLLRQGVYDYPLPRIPGSDGAGVRHETGERVVILPTLHWGEDERAPGPDWEILGDKQDGTYAELVAVPAENVFPLPQGWSFEEGAALPLAGLTAHRALFARGGVQPGETVLVLGAGGGVAGIAVALARMAGARVLVTTSSRAKLDHARALGADGGAIYTEADWPRQILRMTDGTGVDLVIDSVGNTWHDALTATRSGGRLVTFGSTGSAQTKVNVRRFYFAQQTILGTTMGSPRDFQALLDLLRNNTAWRPTIDRIVPLEQAAAAHAAVEARAHTGKVVLAI